MVTPNDDSAPKIMDEDLQQLIQELPLAGEMLRRIMAERQLREMRTVNEAPVVTPIGNPQETEIEDAN